ncbi:MAG: glycosyltransferase family 2 protein [Bacteroidales bacterium]
MPAISVTIITFNEEANILRTLQSVSSFASEIVVVDSLSSDRTPEICREFGCKVYQREFDGYGTQKQFAVDQATNDWIFSIDADEVVTEALQQEIREMFADPVGTPAPLLQYPAYRIPRSLEYMGRVLRYSGAGKELLVRLFDRTMGAFTKVAVHEGIEVNGDTGLLRGQLIHHSYRDISHHLEKINTYTTLAARDYVKNGRHFSKGWAVLKFPVTFLSVYLFKGGFLDGYPGFVWSLLAAVYSTLKVAKTIELTK